MKNITDFVEERKKALASVTRRNNELLKNSDFRTFLEIVADRCNYLTPSRNGSMGEYDRGRMDELRDIVSSFVLVSDNGSQWLAEYAAKRRKVIKNGQQQSGTGDESGSDNNRTSR